MAKPALALDLSRVPRRPDTANSLCSFTSELNAMALASLDSRPGSAASSEASQASQRSLNPPPEPSSRSSHMSFTDELRLLKLAARSARRKEEKRSNDLRRLAAQRMAKQLKPVAPPSKTSAAPLPLSPLRPLEPLEITGDGNRERARRRARAKARIDEHVERQRTARSALLQSSTSSPALLSARPSSRQASSRPATTARPQTSARPHTSGAVARSAQTTAARRPPRGPASAAAAERPLTAADVDSRKAAVAHNMQQLSKSRRRFPKVVPMHGYMGHVRGRLCAEEIRSEPATERLDETLKQLSFNLSAGVHPEYAPHRHWPQGGMSLELHSPKSDPNVVVKHHKGVRSKQLGYGNFAMFLDKCVRLHVDLAATAH